MSDSVALPIELLVRVTIVLGLGAFAALVLRKRSAAIRHLAWSSTLGSALMLAVLVPWTPRLEVPVKGWNAPTTRSFPTLVDSRNLTSASNSEIVAGDVVTTFEKRVPARPVALPPSWFVVWLAGSLVVALFLVAGRLGLSRLTRRATPLSRGAWHDAVRSAAATLGVRRPIAIHESSEVGAPMTWGAWRARLIVPAESRTWSEGLRHSVAAHEVAHVARHDYTVQLMAAVCCAVYWFHPLVWVVARRLRQTAERACDDQVLRAGTNGEDYAAHLIGVARVSRSLRLSGAVAIGMARPSTLEGRIVAVLDGNQPRESPSARTRKSVAIAAAFTLLVIGAVRPVPVSGAPASVTSVTNASESPTAVAAEPEVVTPPIVSSATQGGDSIVERSFSASSGGRLVLDLDAGGGVTVRGWSEPRVTVRAILGGTNWRDVDVEIDREAEGVRVATRFNRRRSNQSTSNHFEIMVPRRYDVRISSSGGSLKLYDLEGRFTGTTGGGEFELERLTGSARLSTGGGEIHVNDVDLSGTVSTGGGTVRLSNVRGGLRGSSGSGPVVYGESSDRSRRSTTDISSVDISRGGSRIRVGNETEYRAGTLAIEKAGGHIDLDAAPNGARVRTGGGDIRIGRSARTVNASTGGGDVAIGPVAGSVIAGTGAGEVHLIVDKSRDQEIEAWSGSGRIIIELPSDFDGRLDLETAYTETFENRVQIRSDWDLERDPLTGWENRYGTPRRTLRARAVLGRGEGRVTVRTVNGEIVIRRR